MDISIVSERLYKNAAYWHVVHEWEDVFSEYFRVINISNKTGIFVRKVMEYCFNKHPRIFDKILIGRKKFKSDGKQIKFCFVMNAKNYKLYTQKNNIPIFLDFPYNMIDEITNATKHIPFFYVTCYAIYEEFLNRKCRNVKYIPLSISDKYIINEEKKKTIDVIQFGRKNKILHDYMIKYCETHKDVEYVYQTDGEKLTYNSTQRGDIGKFDTRAEYFDLMAQCKVSLVSSPAVDGGRDFGDGIDFITPRFYESVANYCYMVGRYTENVETKSLNISTLCDNIKDYNQFEECMDRYLSAEAFLKKREYQEFLEKNKTSRRVEKIKGDLKILDEK